MRRTCRLASRTFSGSPVMITLRWSGCFASPSFEMWIVVPVRRCSSEIVAPLFPTISPIRLFSMEIVSKPSRLVWICRMMSELPVRTISLIFSFAFAIASGVPRIDTSRIMLDGFTSESRCTYAEQTLRTAHSNRHRVDLLDLLHVAAPAAHQQRHRGNGDLHHLHHLGYARTPHPTSQAASERSIVFSEGTKDVMLGISEMR